MLSLTEMCNMIINYLCGCIALRIVWRYTEHSILFIHGEPLLLVYRQKNPADLVVCTILNTVGDQAGGV